MHNAASERFNGHPEGNKDLLLNTRPDVLCQGNCHNYVVATTTGTVLEPCSSTVPLPIALRVEDFATHPCCMLARVSFPAKWGKLWFVGLIATLAWREWKGGGSNSCVHNLVPQTNRKKRRNHITSTRRKVEKSTRIRANIVWRFVGETAAEAHRWQHTLARCRSRSNSNSPGMLVG